VLNEQVKNNEIYQNASSYFYQMILIIIKKNDIRYLTNFMILSDDTSNRSFGKQLTY